MYRCSFFSLFSACALAGALSGCSSQFVGSASQLPVATASTSVGPGDIIEIQVVGENLPKEFRIQSDGSIDFPYLQRIYVAGLEPQDIVSLLRQRLMEAKVLVNPQISLLVRQYMSKKISVIGQV